MKYILILSFLICSLDSLAQGPGYQGKNSLIEVDLAMVVPSHIFRLGENFSEPFMFSFTQKVSFGHTLNKRILVNAYGSHSTFNYSYNNTRRARQLGLGLEGNFYFKSISSFNIAPFGKYVGLRIGFVNTKSQGDYPKTNEFTNNSNGLEVGVLYGRRYIFSDRFVFRWELSTSQLFTIYLDEEYPYYEHERMLLYFDFRIGVGFLLF